MHILWYVEVHTGDELVVLDGLLINLHLTHVWIIFIAVGASPPDLAFTLAMCQIRFATQQE